jgi:rhodanese-related sulfurtransferase
MVRHLASGRSVSILSLLCLVAVAGLLSVGCSDEVKVNDTDIQMIQFTELQAKLNDPKAQPLVIVDVRRADKFAAGHIPGAINIFLPNIKDRDAALASATTIIVYGAGWTDYLSPAAAKRLIRMRYNNVYDFRGGLEQWKSEGGKVEELPAATAPATTAATQPVTKP